jgi:hypothetical protein
MVEVMLAAAKEGAMKRRTVRAGGCLAALLGLGLMAWAAPPPADVAGLSKQLETAVASQSTSQVQKALEGLLEAGGEQAVSAVLKQVQRTYGKGSQSIYWQLVNGASGFRDKEALRALGAFVVKTGKKKGRAPIARDLMFGLENNSSPNTTEALGQIIRDKRVYDLQLMAADMLAQVHTTASVDILIEALKREEKGDPGLRRRIVSALSSITKEDMGDALNWIGWWEANRGKGLPKAGSVRSGGPYATSVLNRGRRKQFESLDKDPRRIVVISSRLPKVLPVGNPDVPGRDYDLDHMEKVLQGMKIPHTVALKMDFEKDPEKYLKHAWTILVNCNYIQTQCICKDCRRILGEKKRKGQAIGGKSNRLYGCPPECSVHDRRTYRLTKETVMKLKRWVDAGGYLFTEDWGIIEIVEVAWPSLVTSDKRVAPGGAGGQMSLNLVRECVVQIVPGKGMITRPILRGVFTRPRPPARDDGGDGKGTRQRRSDEEPTRPPSYKWKIDDESPAIRVNSQGAVSVLMRSEELGKKANGNDAVAVTFRAGKGKPWVKREKEGKRTLTGSSGKGWRRGRSRGRGLWKERLPGGRVLHVISHFGKQQSTKSDTFVLQNLILNFIIESNRQHGGS